MRSRRSHASGASIARGAVAPRDAPAPSSPPPRPPLPLPLPSSRGANPTGLSKPNNLVFVECGIAHSIAGIVSIEI
jgi:hypothetical protein